MVTVISSCLLIFIYHLYVTCLPLSTLYMHFNFLELNFYVYCITAFSSTGAI